MEFSGPAQHKNVGLTCSMDKSNFICNRARTHVWGPPERRTLLCSVAHTLGKLALKGDHSGRLRTLILLAVTEEVKKN